MTPDRHARMLERAARKQHRRRKSEMIRRIDRREIREELEEIA